MDHAPEPRGENYVWRQFLIGIGCVLTFVVVSVLLVAAIGGGQAGVDYFLIVLIVTLLTGMVDGIALARRRNR